MFYTIRLFPFLFGSLLKVALSWSILMGHTEKEAITVSNLASSQTTQTSTDIKSTFRRYVVFVCTVMGQNKR